VKEPVTWPGRTRRHHEFTVILQLNTLAQPLEPDYIDAIIFNSLSGTFTMNTFFRRLAIFSLFSIFLFSSTALATTVLAIDYGSDYIKASLIKPGMPFDVLLDKDSKRKIRSSVAWKNGERLFGQDAFNLVRAIPFF
jgi:hypothetical protein